uniref:Pco127259 n=1 Tax=Arundo donax TaxID=35708 RepID=A0A0A9HTS6_ARUDO
MSSMLSALFMHISFVMLLRSLYTLLVAIQPLCIVAVLLSSSSDGSVSILLNDSKRSGSTSLLERFYSMQYSFLSSDTAKLDSHLFI